MNTFNLRAVSIVAVALALAGCVSANNSRSWGRVHWPDGAEFKQAAARAAKDPVTWVPLVGAALLTIGNADGSISDWAADKRPLFGSNAADASNTLLDISKAAYFVTALIAPSDSLHDKFTGLALGVGTIALNNSITQGLKSVVGRERPNGRDDRSFPSGHASNASTAATLAVANLAYMPLPDWASTGLTIGLYSVAGGAAWARVEAEKHHVIDSLVGYSLGHFVARFMQEAFFEAGAENLAITYMPMAQGGAVTLRMPLRARRE
ncbi:MAG: phosphatase PAP2 family protein [Gammaproteobacteria bacterium]|nr:phosphatase PAP2 family protein [Gammaproteobacteria bacterium]